MCNTSEVMVYILKELNKNGDPYSVEKRCGISEKKFKEIIHAMVDDGYVTSSITDMLGTPQIEKATITSKGYKLMNNSL